MAHGFRWHSRQVACRKIWHTARGRSVRAMQLGPCFLEQANPELVLLRVGENESLGALDNGQIVVNQDLLLRAVHVQVDTVNSRSVDLFGLEQVTDLLGLLSENTKNRQKVTIGQCTLAHIIRTDAFREELG